MERDVILLIEDNPDDLALTLRALRKNNYGKEVAIARDGVEALNYFSAKGEGEHFLPRLIVLDLKLPRVDGLQVLKQLRADDRTSCIPVVILTSSNEEQDIINCYRLGANSYIRKPVNYAKFSEVMGQLSAYWMHLNEPAPGQFS